METERAPRRGWLVWPLAVGTAVCALVAASAVYHRWPTRHEQAAAPPSSAQTVMSAPPASKPSPGPAKPIAPTFDVVRVRPDGGSVIAGRAAPGAHVTVREGDRTLGEVDADGSGQFVLIPNVRIRPGGRELTLVERGADGSDIKGPESVVVMVPEPASPAPTPALAVLLPPPNVAPRVLQGPDAQNGKELALRTVDYDNQGSIRFAGSAPPEAPVRVYVDNTAVGGATADAGGRWALTPPGTIAPGLHRLRVDQLGANGRVAKRVELPFQRSAAPADSVPGQTIVQPGQNLWRIARTTYGSGVRYTIIYLANREQIRDPNRIYPGQVFAVPPGQ